MQRQFEALTQGFDVLVLGGGVHGVALARTLALSGIQVALVEKGDFGGEATHNSLKIVHGGLRYVQHMDSSRIKESVRAQRSWLTAAPHLVRPMECTIPTRGWGTRSPIALAAGGAVYAMLGGRSKHRTTPVSSMPNGRLRSLRDFRAAFPEIRPDRINGGYSWYDAQIRDSGRLITECAQDADHAGATLVNHAEAVMLRCSGKRVTGALVRDNLTGMEQEVRARFTVGTLGAWGAGLAQRSGLPVAPAKDITWTRNVNIVLKRRITSGGTIGVMSRHRGDGVIGGTSRLYFITPWQDTSIVGTLHDRHHGAPEPLAVKDDEIASLLTDIDATVEPGEFAMNDIAYVHMGLTPSEEAGRQRAKRSVVIDYARVQDIDGYIEIVANKYTTAPTVSAHVSRIVMDRLGYSSDRLADFSSPLPGARLTEDPSESVGPDAGQEERETAWVQAIYGLEGRRIVETAQAQPGDTTSRLFRARIIHGAREGMAVRLADGIFRCSDLAERGMLREGDLQWCLEWMAHHFGWTEERRQEELNIVLTRLRRHKSGGPGFHWSQQAIRCNSKE